MRKLISALILLSMILSSVSVFAESISLTVLNDASNIVQEGEEMQKVSENEGDSETKISNDTVISNDVTVSEDSDVLSDNEMMYAADVSDDDIQQTNILDFIRLEKAIEYPNEDFSEIVTDRFIIRDNNGIRFDRTDVQVNAQEYITELKANDPEILYAQPDYTFQLNSVDNGWAFNSDLTLNMAEIEPRSLNAVYSDNLIYNDYIFNAGTDGINKYVSEDGTVVAVLDTAMDIEHEQIAGHIYKNSMETSNGQDSDGNGYKDDISGWNFVNDTNAVCSTGDKYDTWHATGISGIIAEIAPDAEILPLKVFENGQAYTSDIIRAIDYSRKAGATVINCSFSGTNESPLLREMMLNCGDILFVCAAGNEGADLEQILVYPASYDLDNVITVASVNQYGALSSFSGYSLSKVDIAAPGEKIMVSLTDNQYGEVSGTSVSAAFVSAAAALLCEQDIQPTDMKEQINTYSVKLYSLKDKIRGAAMLNISNLLKKETNNKYIYLTKKNENKQSLFNSSNRLLSNINALSNTDTVRTEPSGWQPAGQMTTSRSNMSSIVYNDNIYVFGGDESGTIVDKAEMYDTQTGQWSTRSAMPEGRYRHTAIELDGKVYICAGYTSDGAKSSIDVNNIETDQWEASIETPDNITNYAAAIYDNELYIFGGKKDGVNITSVYKYTFETGEWERLGDIPKQTVDEKTVISNGVIRVFAGSTILEYNISSKSWSTLDTLSRMVYDYAVINRSAKDSGYQNRSNIYVTGGREVSDGGTAIPNVKIRYDDDPNMASNWVPEWYNDLRMIRGLACHNMVIANGYVYVFGGQVNYGVSQEFMYKRSMQDVIDDHPTTTPFLANKYIYGSINDDGDRDSFTFVPEVDGYYLMKEMEAIQSNNGNIIFYIAIDDDQNCIVDARLTMEFGAVFLQGGKTYTVTLFDIEGVTKGNYAYEIRQVQDDVPDTLEESIPIEINKEINKTFIGWKDIDCMCFDIQESGSYSIDMLRPYSGPYTTYSQINIYNSNYEIIDSFDNKTESTHKISFEQGKYYICVSPRGFDTAYANYTLAIRKANSELNTARGKHSLVKAADELYVIGGVDSQLGNVNAVEKIDTKSDLCTNVTTIPLLRGGTASIGVNNNVYYIGGYLSRLYYDRINIYNTQTGVWSEGRKMMKARECMSLASDGTKIYIAGGRDRAGYIDTMEIYDIAANSITVSELPEACMDASLVWVNDSLYMAGGVGSTGYSDKLYQYKDGVWTEKSALPCKPEQIKSGIYNNGFVSVMVVDGNIKIFYYNAELDQWIEQENKFVRGELNEPLTQNIRDYDVESYGNTMYLTGGFYGNEALSSIYKYDLSYINMRDTASSDVILQARQGKTLPVAIDVQNMDFSSGREFVLTYNSNVLKLNDACAQTWAKNKTVGAVAGTDIEIISISNSEIKFRMKKQVILTGTVNIVMFDCLSNGTAELNISVSI